MTVSKSSQVIRTTKLVTILMFCLVNPLAGWAYLHQAHHRTDRVDGRLVDTLRTHRLRVLPLDGDSDGAAERWRHRLTDALRESHGLEVWSASDPSVGIESSPADFIVHGSYEREGERLRIHAWLMLEARSEVLWLQTFEGEEADVDAWCDASRLAILNALAVFRG